MKRVLGLDLGTSSLGIALSRTGVIASAYENYSFPNGQYITALNHLDEIIEQEQIEHIAIGFPLHMNGDESKMGRIILKFVEEIKRRHPTMTVKLIDERWTTVQANKILMESKLTYKDRKKVIDKMAAQVILETYLAQQGE